MQSVSVSITSCLYLPLRIHISASCTSSKYSVIIHTCVCMRSTFHFCCIYIILFKPEKVRFESSKYMQEGKNVKFDISSVASELCNSEQLTSPFWVSFRLSMDFVFVMLLDLLNPETSLLSLWVDLKGSCPDSGLTGTNQSLCPSELSDSPCLVTR